MDSGPSEELERIVRDFARSWRPEEPGRIEDAIRGADAIDRGELLGELVRTEIELRRSRGEVPTLDEYESRFPAEANAIRSLFAGMETIDQPRAGEAETITVAPRPAADPVPRGRLGDYEILERIGRGGMGLVYRARQRSLDRLVALKTIRAGDLSGDEEEVRRFRGEAETAATFKHPHVVPVFDFGEIDGTWFFSMELVEGGTLNDLLRDGPVEPRRAAELVRTIAEAVDYAHGRGIVHRDLKPGNVLLDENGQPKVTDFGLAKRVREEGDLTRTGQVLGTASYMPPEQARGEEVDARADVYALGAVLYALLTGRPPFQAADLWETLRQVAEREPVAPRQLNPAVPRDVETICLKCLQKSKSDRYESASELVEELTRFLEGRPIAARPVGRLERFGRWCRRNPTTALLSGSVLLLVVAVAITATVGYVVTNDALTESESRLAGSEYLRGLELCRLGDVDLGLLHMVEALAHLPEETNDQELFDLEESIRLNIATWTQHLHTLEMVLEGEALASKSSSDRTGARLPDGRFLTNAIGRGLRVRNPDGSSSLEIDLPGGVGTWTTDPTGRWLACTSRDEKGDLHLWNLAKGGSERLAGRRALAFSPDGTRLLVHATAAPPGRFDLLALDEAGKHESVGTIDVGEAVRGVDFGHDGKTVIFAIGTRIERWDVETNERIGEPIDHGAKIDRFFELREGRRFVTEDRTFRGPATEDDPEAGNAKIWNAETGELLATADHGMEYPPRPSPDERLLLTAVPNARWVELRDVETGALSMRPLFTESISIAPRYSADGRYVLCGTIWGHGYVWDTVGVNGLGRERLGQFAHRGQIVDSSFATYSNVFATGSTDGEVRAWSLPDMKQVGQPLPHPRATSDVDLSLDGRHLFVTTSTSANPKTAEGVSTHVWRTARPAVPPIQFPAGYWGGPVTTSPDGRFIVVQGAVEATGKPVKRELVTVFDPFAARVVAVLPRTELHEPRFDGEGRLLVDNGEGRVQRLDLEKGRFVGTLIEVDGHVVATSNDEKFAVVLRTRQLTPKKTDRRLLLVDVESGETVRELAHLKTSSPARFQFTAEDVAEFAAGERTGDSKNRFAATAGGFGFERAIGQRIVVHDLSTGVPIAELEHPGVSRGVRFAGLGDDVIATLGAGQVQLWDDSTFERVGDPLQLAAEVMTTAFGANGRLLLAAGQRGDVRLWHVPTRMLVGPPLKMGDLNVEHATFSPTGAYAVVNCNRAAVGVVPIAPPVAGTAKELRERYERLTRRSLR